MLRVATSLEKTISLFSREVATLSIPS